MAAWGADSTALAVICPLSTHGQILLGPAIFFGAAIRSACFFAGAMMFLFHTAQFPPEHGLFVDYHILYVVACLLFGAMAAGRVLGLDGIIDQLPWIGDRAWPRYLLG